VKDINLMSGETKICPFCAECISGAAKLCPRCRQWLSWRSFRHPAVGFVVVFGMMVFLGAGLDGVFRHFLNPPPFYSDFLGTLQVVQSRMTFLEASNNSHIYIIGVVTNQGPVAWHDLEFECRFYGTNGDLLDAYTAQSPVTVLAQDDGAFRLTLTPVAKFSDYASVKLFIGNARNLKSRF